MNISEISIYNQNNEGLGIGKLNNTIVFVPYSLKDELIDIKIIKKNKNFYEGYPVKLKKTSIERQKPACPYYYECGGCNIMHQKYEYQLKFKTSKVINNLSHIAGIKFSNNIQIEYDREFNYRNHITLSINKKQCGFYKSNSNEIIDIDECLITNKKINKCIKEIKKFLNVYNETNITKISIKAYETILINISCINFNLLEEFKKHVTYDSLYINNKHIDKNKYAVELIDKYKFKISSMSFFQKNTTVMLKLYKYIKNLLNNRKNVLDLYCGVGTIGIFISDVVKSVTGIEIINEGIDDAKENAKINNISNISFINGKVEDYINEFEDTDTIIVDPPRIGLDKKTINQLITLNTKQIIYISCNSTTLARDLKLLQEKYKIDSIKLFDMFPNTYHVECVVNLIFNEGDK